MCFIVVSADGNKCSILEKHRGSLSLSIFNSTSSSLHACGLTTCCVSDTLLGAMSECERKNRLSK
jgi:hypothetical protein